MYVTNTGAVSSLASSAATLFDLTAGGTFTTTTNAGAITAPNINLTTAGADYDIVIDANLGNAGTGTIQLNSANAISETSGTIQANTLNMTATADIGATVVAIHIQSNVVNLAANLFSRDSPKWG